MSLRSCSTEMIPEFTVTEITDLVRQVMHDTFYCIKIRGEISGLSRPSSGHVYLSLKDDNSVISAVCWNGTRLDVQFENGLEVICTGHLSTYQSRYQLVIEGMVLAGQGKLAAMLEERRKKLEKEGLFDQARKKPLPLLPLKIGVITSPTGAVIRDILNRVKHRFPSHIIVWPVQVQGSQASAMVVQAILGFNNLEEPPDVIIVARGGGSIEDLWPFNDEELARTTAASKIPIVSAIGHETDFTIIDYAADVRAPTPTAAVEIVLPERQQLVSDIAHKLSKIRSAVRNVLGAKEHRLLQLYGVLTETKHKISEVGRSALAHQEKIEFLFKVALLKKQQYLDNLIGRIDRYNKEHIISVGYAVIYDNTGQHVSSANAVAPDDTIVIEWKDGKRRAAILT
ncbi:exodeoxyribonuclease large subunit [Anaplasma marginale str. St. Maries]|uniref:Exodeoxyribonuclease 7 large subunit n=1 Tax=Anaplasma marginale (strain St. Maries) TaxID=234826 RepID=EX7L_ANAMM|nr:exodeoxyribonuclease VII large subunit [Anaplasma marginale]Q5P9B4.1 RecName: Full=Exodeoxyribonuclease 7 large subunit; AltName: Full=Exodeoxyribonuclease VII large subunit; Short=Exonuclease VII large subunit [Anaplasma marginale str. St. Maries]AAV87116.1 exodeoxyribonuclease large subunit [Anaplasma marginale str. St. Maries]